MARTETIFEIGTRKAMAMAATCTAATPTAPCKIDSTRNPLWRNDPCTSELSEAPPSPAMRPVNSA